MTARLRLVRTLFLIGLGIALAVALLIYANRLRTADSRAFAATFATLEVGMTKDEVRRRLGPPDSVDVQPSYALSVRLRRTPKSGRFGTVDTWYYGGSPEDPKSDLYVVDFDGKRLFFAGHVGPGE